MTRFSQYLHRVYNNLNDIYYLYYIKIEQLSNSNIEDASEYRSIKDNLNNVKFVIYFLSMLEISNILASASTSVQECDRLPWYGKNILLHLMNKLNLAKAELKNGKVPSDWKYFDQQIKDLNSGVYKKVPLLLEGQQCTTIQVSTR